MLRTCEPTPRRAEPDQTSTRCHREPPCAHMLGVSFPHLWWAGSVVPTTPGLVSAISKPGRRSQPLQGFLNPRPMRSNLPDLVSLAEMTDTPAQTAVSKTPCSCPKACRLAPPPPQQPPLNPRGCSSFPSRHFQFLMLWLWVALSAPWSYCLSLARSLSVP